MIICEKDPRISLRTMFIKGCINECAFVDIQVQLERIIEPFVDLINVGK